MIYVIPKSATKKENYQAFSIALRVHLAKYTTIHSSKAPESHVKIITYMNIENRFYLLAAVVFIMGTQLGLIGKNLKNLLFTFALEEGKPYQNPTLEIFRKEAKISAEI